MLVGLGLYKWRSSIFRVGEKIREPAETSDVAMPKYIDSDGFYHDFIFLVEPKSEGERIAS